MHKIDDAQLKPKEQASEHNMKAHSANAVKSVKPPKIFDLSYGERGLWYLWKTNPDSCTYLKLLFKEIRIHLTLVTYNIAFYPKFSTSDFDSYLMGKCWDEVTARHQMMHTTFIEDDDTGLPKHLIHDNFKNSYEVKTVTKEELELELNEAYRAPFNLITGPLCRLNVFSIGNDHIIMVTAHRI